MIKGLDRKIKRFIKSLPEKTFYSYNYYFGYTDYFNFPFNTTNPLPDNAVEVMQKGCELLDKLGIKYCLADGTLLGVIRDNKLISHDTDIDICILHPVNTKKIIKAFLKNGFKVGRHARALGKTQQLAFYSENNVIFDILFYTKINNTVYNFCEKDFYFQHHFHHYKDFIPYEFNNYTYYIPSDTDKWLETTYGNWKTPRTSKPADWREGGNEYLTAIPYDGKVKKLINKLKKEY